MTRKPSLATGQRGRTGPAAREHAKVEFIFVAVGGFLAQGFENGFLFVVVFGALLVVFFLFEDAEAFALEGLGALAVGAALDAVVVVFWVSGYVVASGWPFPLGRM